MNRFTVFTMIVIFFSISVLSFADSKKIYVVTIPENLSLREISTLLDKQKLIDKKIFLELSCNKSFLESMNIKADSVEGYLFPDTYMFTHSMTTKKIMEKMVNNFWDKLTPKMIKRSEELGLTVHQLVTLASIIGKEEGIDKNKSKVSAVFHNRLKRNICLQSSYSAVYDLEDYNGKISKSHLSRKSPYNTFIIKGLPPGPIANPGLTSLQSALYPLAKNN